MIKNNMVLRIGIFYFLALLSNILRFGLFGLKDLINDLPDWLSIFLRHMQSVGVFAGACVALYLKKKRRKHCIPFGVHQKIIAY